MEVKRYCWSMLTILYFTAVRVQNVKSIGVIGQRETCDNEGEPVELDNIDKHKCYSCICKNGFVECQKNPICPEIKGCHMIETSEEHCCPKCKGCFYNGVYRESNEDWTEIDQPCRALRCEAGVITKSTIQCHVPCDNPTPPAFGKCCPTCPDCRINGHMATEYRDVTPGDLCVKCRCFNGRLTCTKKACPVLQCVKDDQEQKPGECCPTCRGTRRPLDVPNMCVLGNRVYKEGETIVGDQCTRCKCVNQTSICERENCLLPKCESYLQKKRFNSCCKDCIKPEVLEARSQCYLKGVLYEEGQSWSLDACTLCKCQGAMISCVKTRCNETLSCPFGTHLVHEEGECCKKCEENKSEAACMVFGDPHYKTFDGKMYSFQGLGKYQLVSDCHNHSFSIRVTNDFWNRNRSSTVTKRVRIKYGDVRINLGQRYRTRINGNKVNMPCAHERKVKIEKQEYNILVSLNNKVKILWNGHSFLEVTVPISYKNKLCGLCGNFNSNVQDDFKMRKGGIANESNLLKFGTSWCIGRDCSKQTKRTSQIRPCKMKYPKRHMDKNPCKYLTSSELFNGCDSKLNYIKYYNACLKDMCDCSVGKCYCESLTAYAHECGRLGVNVKNWQKNSYCEGSSTSKSHSKQKHQQNHHHNHHQTQLYSKAVIEELSQKLDNKKNRGKEPIIH